MSNALTKFMKSAALPALSEADMAQALQDTATDSSTGGGNGVTYMQFSGKTGRYSLGKNKTEPDDDALYLIEPQSFLEGYICWKKSKPVDRIEWSIYRRSEQAVPVDELPDHGPYRESNGEGWQKMLGFGCIECDEMKENVKFTNNSVSGVNAISDLMMEVSKRAGIGEPSMPIIRFGAEEFTAQDQTNYKPVFEVEVWVDRESAGAYLDPETDYTLDDLIDGAAIPKAKKIAAKKKPAAKKKSASRRK